MSNAAEDTVTNDKNPWSWLGLLKWSLAYSDGTSPTSASPMSEEDKAFLELVMKEGIIDENERMKVILKEVTEKLEGLRTDNDNTTSHADEHGTVQELLQELRDIVEQIDYARAFAAMKGLPFLVGCISQTEIPKSIRSSCLGVLATMASNNPPIQKELLEMGAIKTLSELFDQESMAESKDDTFRAKIMQALGATVRSHELAEGVFCGVEQSRHVILEGLHGSDVLRKRTLFLLRALITSDASTPERVRWFAHAVAYTANHLAVVPPQDTTYSDNNCNASSVDAREMALGLLTQLLEQRKSVNTVLDRKDFLVGAGVQRVAALRALTGDERELACVELELWETLLVQLARATRDDEPVQPNPETVPQ